MDYKVWFRKTVTILFMLGTAVAAALWVAAITAKCEGFGCLGVGTMIGMAVLVQFVTAIFGGILIWINKQQNQAPPAWLMAIETLHMLPLLWFGGRLLVS